MKILSVLLLFLILCEPFLVYANYNNEEIIGIDHEKGIVAKIIRKVVEVSEFVFAMIDRATEWITEEIEYRQKVIQNQIQERKENLIKKISDRVIAFLKSLIESTTESITDSFKKGGD